MQRIAVVTGAGSGVGRAVALRMARDGWAVALVGRTERPLAETARLAAPDAAERIAAFPCDVAESDAVERMSKAVLDRFGTVHALVNSAGINIPNRGLSVLSVDDYRRVIDVNLNGAFYCVRAFLPAMRAQRSGTIVNINSDVGLLASPKSGAAYVASKFGVTGLTQQINAEERAIGVRACSIHPGDINTPLLDKRPSPPAMELRKHMLQPDDVAECVMLAINLPPNVVVEMMLVRPR